jgi:Dyp-type peroxidase family
MARTPLDLHDVQANVLRPVAYPLATYVFLEVQHRPRAAAWLHGLLPSVTTAAPWSVKPHVVTTVAVSNSGLGAFGVPVSVRDSFPTAFRDGMAARASVLGDSGASDPSHWDAPHAGAAHLLVTLHTRNLDELARAVDELERSAGDGGLAVHTQQPAHRLLHGREHFGFVDGMGQPAVAGVATAPPAQGSPPSHWWQRAWRPLAVGEFVHGHPDNDGVPGPAPMAPFARNGTFTVYRKLAQDVPGFRAHVDEQARRRGLDPDLVAAKLVGRWQDGTPLVLSPDAPDPELAADPRRVNDFGYRDDVDGYRCPVGAHIRRANPRDALGFGASITGRHRMLRRGMPYGREFDPARGEDEERGLVFVAHVADIERQFEFVQAQWCNDGDAFGLGTDSDGVLGGQGKMTVQGNPPWFVSPLGRFVTTRAGIYLYTPSMTGLRALATGGAS